MPPGKGLACNPQLVLAAPHVTASQAPAAPVPARLPPCRLTQAEHLFHKAAGRDMPEFALDLRRGPQDLRLALQGALEQAAPRRRWGCAGHASLALAAGCCGAGCCGLLC